MFSTLSNVVFRPGVKIWTLFSVESIYDELSYETKLWHNKLFFSINVIEHIKFSTELSSKE